MTLEEQGLAQERTAAPSAKKRRGPFRMSLVVLILGVLLIPAGVVPLATGFHDYIATSRSMAPSIEPGDHVVVRKGGATTAKRGDLVLVDVRAWVGVKGLTFRRVIGVGGDRVACCTSGHVTVNGKPLEQPYVSADNASLISFSVTVPAGRLFLLADDRTTTVDSWVHPVGTPATLPVTDVKGLVAWPNRNGTVAGAAGSLKLYIGLLAFGVLLAGLGLVSAIVGAGRAERRRRPTGPLTGPPTGPPVGLPG